MPRQNRVTPFGDIVAVPERGTFMGNRGILHDVRGRVRRAWQVKRWIVCLLEFRGRHRTVMAPHSYTELFFLDEATALAAGHRPCAECRHARFLAFCDAWKIAHGGQKRPRADAIDARLHSERIGPDRGKRTFTAELADLPDGVFVTVEDRGEAAYLVRGRHLLEWSPAGYRKRRPRPGGGRVRVLTPASTVETIRAGYVPEIHASAAPSHRTG
jgi:hypothetical protein